MKKIPFYLIFALSIVLGIYFIYKGFTRNLIPPCRVYDETSTLPIHYRNLNDALCQSGFMKIIGALEVLSGLLLVFPKTRLLGNILLMPVIITIFLFHAIIDNRPHELVETGIPLLINVLIFAYYYPKWKDLLWIKD